MTRQKKWLLEHPLYNRLYVQRNKEKINERRRKTYQINKGKFIKKDRERKYSGTEFIRKLKDAPCTDCGIKYPYYVMHFDHRDPKLKRRSLAVMSTYSKETIMTEVAKCDLVCANCHAKRTYEGVQAGKIKMFGRYYVQK